MHIWNERQPRPNRWKKTTDNLLCDIFHIDSNSSRIFFNDTETIIVEPCHLFMEMETPCVENYDYASHKPDILDLSLLMKLSVPTSNILVKLRPEHLNYLLKCLDLNFTYQDGHGEVYNFKLGNTEMGKSGVKYRVEANISVISVTLIGNDTKVITEFVIKRFNMNWVNYQNNTKIIQCGANYLYALHEPKTAASSKKSIIMSPLMSENEVSSDEFFYSWNEEEPKLGRKESTSFLKLGGGNTKQVQAEIRIDSESGKICTLYVYKHKIFMEYSMLMLVKNWVIENLPNYEKSPEKPNECK